MSIYEIFAAKALAAYWEDVNANMQDPMIGTSLFPNKKVNGLDLSWIKGKNALPVVLQPSAYDAKASLRDRIGVEEIQTELPFFREAMRIGEKDRQELGNLLARGEEFAQATIARIYDDETSLINGAEAQAERMRMSLLTGAAISVAASDDTGRTVAYDYNYDTTGDWATDNNTELTGNDVWTAAKKATSNPIQDLLDVVDTARENGVILTKAIMNSVTLKGMLASESIVKAINPNGATSMIVTRAQAQRYVEDMTGLTFIVYDKSFVDENGSTVKFFPDNYVSLIPDGTLGNTYFGTTPEEYDLLSGVATDAECKVVGAGIAVTTIKEAHPVNVKTVVSAQMLPSFEQIDKVYVIKVA